MPEVHCNVFNVKGYMRQEHALMILYHVKLNGDNCMKIAGLTVPKISVQRWLKVSMGSLALWRPRKFALYYLLQY